MLWQIQNRNIFLYGSVHATDMDPPILPAPVMRAYGMAQRVVFEADTAGLQPEIFDMPAGAVLADVVPSPIVAKMHRHLARLGVPRKSLDRRWPSLASSALTMTAAARSGYTRERGIDHYMEAMAREDGKQVYFLETAANQISVFANAPMEEQISILDHSASSNDAGLSEIRELVAAWKNDDFEFLASYAESRLARWPVAFEQLINLRNQQWVDLILKLPDDGVPMLIVGGILHFVLDCSVPSLLERRGIRLHAIPTPLP